MQIQVQNYKKANEVLYVLNAVEKIAGGTVSKIAIQKLLYLSACLAPIKNLVLAFIKFHRIQRGPYSSEIQNIVDHLVAYDLIKIVQFKVLYEKNSIAYYQITDGGKKAVALLTKYSVEEEKYWWIESVAKLAYIFSMEKHISDNDQYEGLDKIVYLVYQEHTFKEAKTNKKFKALIDFENSDGATQLIIDFVKNYLQENIESLSIHDERKQAELILLAFFEQFLANYIEEQNA
jgi:hypothetical protein